MQKVEKIIYNVKKVVTLDFNDLKAGKNLSSDIEEAYGR